MHHKILNFRNIGNIQTPDGIIKPGFFYRGGPLHNLTSETKEFLIDALKIKTVIDFRDDFEVARETNDPDFNVVRLNILKDQKMSADPETLIKEHNISAQNLMENLYRNIINSENSQKEYAKFFDILLETQSPVYFHCSAGKDRTGLAAAFILKVLGASDADIIHDYLLTNELSKNNIESRIQEAGMHLEVTDDIVNMIRAFSGVEIAYLNAAYDEINKHYGSFDNYVEIAFDLSQNKINKLKDKYIMK